MASWRQRGHEECLYPAGESNRGVVRSAHPSAGRTNSGLLVHVRNLGNREREFWAIGGEGSAEQRRTKPRSSKLTSLYAS